MITCPICHTENHHLAVTCVSCKSFLQQRIENLDLFSTLGHLIESPLKAFQTIAVARHKNFMLILSAILGWPVVFTLFWIAHAGEYASSFLNLLIAGLATGPFVGLILVVLIASILSGVSKISRIRISFRNSFALSAFSFTPMVYSFLFIFPVIFLSFGLYFFTINPSPYTLRPFSYRVLSVLHCFLSGWGLLLFLIGIKVTSGARWGTSILIWVTTCLLTGGLIYGVLRIFVA